MQAIQSPFVVRFEASFGDQNSVYIIMQYAERGSLADHARSMVKNKQRFAEDVVWKCMCQVMSPQIRKLAFSRFGRRFFWDDTPRSIPES